MRVSEKYFGDVWVQGGAVVVVMAVLWLRRWWGRRSGIPGGRLCCDCV